jgi:hypothetical protein
MQYAEENARNLTHSTVYQIEKVLVGVGKVPLNYASLLSARNFEAEDIVRLVDRMVSANPEI